MSALGAVPSENARSISLRFGDAGDQFLRRLPTLLQDIAEEWTLTLGDPLPVGVGGYLVCAKDSGGSDTVLKLCPTGGVQDAANEAEAYALARWNGHGAVRLIRCDLSQGAILVERCIPGTALSQLEDDEMITQGCLLARGLHLEVTENDLRSVGVAAVEDPERMHPSLKGLVSNGIALSIEHANETIGDPLDPVFCHGDMNPGNVLASERQPWLAVDPLPTVADAAYDAASLVWAKRSWLLAQDNPTMAIRRRITLASEVLGEDASRVWAWTVIRLAHIIVDRLGWGNLDQEVLLATLAFLSSARQE